MKFTFYGDLLGISAYYKLGPKVAKDKLNEFYNTCFSTLEKYIRENPTTTSVNMFSDSLIFTGHDATEALERLHFLYIQLLNKGLMLRGALVSEGLEFEERLTIDNFQKQLPRDDTLARAVGLESTKKGARLLIEPALASVLLKDQKEWLTLEGYVSTVTRREYSNVSKESILRRICPTPESDSYECLYFWVCFDPLEPDESDYQWKIDDLESIAEMVDSSSKPHYNETISLLKRCKARQKLTNDNFE